jgi:L-fuconolactonase
MRSDRRRFLEVVSGSVLGMGLFDAVAESKPPADVAAIAVVDTHQHLWDIDKFHLPWLETAGVLRRSFVAKDYREATKHLRVIKSVYMEIDVTPAEQVAEAEYVIELCRSGQLPTAAAVIGGRPASEGFPAYVRRFRCNKYVKGVRQVLAEAQPEKPFFLERTFVNNVRLLGELGMSFDLCLPASMLEAGAKLVDACPGTRFILDHCGNANVATFRAAAGAEAARREVEAWRRSIARLAERKQVVCKISGIIASVPQGRLAPDDLAPIVNHCLDSFGPDRVMFGSDWPVCTQRASLQRWVEVLAAIVAGRSRQQQSKLFAENALKFYAL